MEPKLSSDSELLPQTHCAFLYGQFSYFHASDSEEVQL